MSDRRDSVTDDTLQAEVEREIRDSEFFRELHRRSGYATTTEQLVAHAVSVAVRLIRAERERTKIAGQCLAGNVESCPHT